MQGLDKLTEEFKFKYERYLTGCDALEEAGLWDTEELGQMEAYYQNDLMGVILRLIAADGKISDGETEYLNRAFGFTCTTQELRDFYAGCEDSFKRDFAEQLEAGYRLMRGKNEKLAEAYRELLDLACTILMVSDGAAGPEETAVLKKARDRLQSAR